MAAPGHGFGAQERDPPSVCELSHFGHDRLECGSQHEVGRRQEVENAIAAFPYLRLWRSRFCCRGECSAMIGNLELSDLSSPSAKA
jgi:hypothetical protein